jgi:hypothetical protein
MKTDLDYHLHRARTERDVAYRSADGLAADIHMRLSALHLSQALLLQAVQSRAVGNVLPFQPSRAAAQPPLLPLPPLQLPSMG